ncbi:hypothetical protein [Streptomyces sp. bgisy126]|uniref:hypothetical protein n=1 Tax=unclassified Streptomyces TaxID=2593676 RepID=UPI003EBE8956
MRANRPAGGFRPAPSGLVRLRFSDAADLGRAEAAFRAGQAPVLGDAWSNPEALALTIRGEAAVETVRAVLGVLDAAALVPEAFTVHSHELDDVLASFGAPS